jgi:hypothetical protein
MKGKNEGQERAMVKIWKLEGRVAWIGRWGGMKKRED